MKLAVYHRTVPNKKNQEKIDLLKNFSVGAKLVGDQVIDVHDHQYHTSDVAVIQGWVAENTTSAHLQLRNQIITNQLASKKHVIAVDSNVFLYATPGNPLHYLRYSFDSVFPDLGIYCDTNIDSRRWQQISQHLGISLKPYRNSGNHILLCLQRNGGWSMGNYNVVNWALDTIQQLRKHTQRPIRLRPHPGDRQSSWYCQQIISACDSTVSQSSLSASLIEDLQNCWAVINHNSSPTVGAAIEGYPVFVTDPVRSQCKDIANTDLSAIENPALPDRQHWVERLSMSHWNFDELKSGQCWQHMRKYVL